EGLTLVKQQFINALAGFGVAPIDALGQPFDPSQHEAVMTSVAQSSAEDGQVVEVFRTGYRTDSQVLRPSLVKVARLG
ncbi:MAG: nucleotide exchange factor GrpE, partial [Myxococcales bacterium]|nr:nucleotide exchange factor GrpE [Myxococcales bacterium]